MASKVNGLIQKINPGNNTNYSIASTAYGYCETAAATAEKTVEMTGFTLLEGTTIHVKFKNKNSAKNPTLNVNGTGAKPIVQYGTTAAGTSEATNGWYAGAVVSFTYDGTSWVRDQGFNTNTTYSNAIQVYNRTSIGTSPNFDDPGKNGFFEVRAASEITGATGTRPFANSRYGNILSLKTPDNISMMQIAGTNDIGWYIRGKQAANVTLEGTAWEKLVTNSGTWGISITGNAATSTTAEKSKILSLNTTMEYGWNGINYFNISAANQGAVKVNDTPYTTATWAHILRFNHANSTGYYTDLSVPFDANGLYYKRVVSGSLKNSTNNGGWVKLFDNSMVVPVENGGTGASAAREGFHALSAGLTEGGADIDDDTFVLTGSTDHSTNSWYRRKGIRIYNYIKNKLKISLADIGAAPVASPALTGTPTAPTAAADTNNTQIATTAFVYNAFTANDAMVFKGVVNSNSDLPATHKQGWTYKIGTAGTYAGQSCEIGDTIYCVADGTSANNNDWVIVQTNLDGAVIGPASSTVEHVAVFTGSTGKAIKDSGFTLGKSVPSTAVFTDTTYSAEDGISLSGTTFSNSGVRSVSIQGDSLRVNTGGENSDLTIPFAIKATQDSSGNTITSTYVKKSGDTMTGALTLNTIIGTSANYGDTLPSSGVVGQIFFLKRSE